MRLAAWVGIVLLGGVACTSEPVKESAAKKTHLITAVAGSGGAVFPKGDVPVEEGADRAFVITPDEGYQVRALSVDGADLGATTSYTFQEVRKPHTLAVQFTPLKSEKPAAKKPKGQKPVTPSARPKPVEVVADATEPEAVAEQAAPPARQPVRTVKPVAAKPKPAARTAATAAAVPAVAATTPEQAPPVAVEAPPAEVQPAAKPVEAESRAVVEAKPVEAKPTVAAAEPAGVEAPPITPIAQRLKDGMSAEDQGLAIVQESDRRDTGFGDFRADIIMVLANPNGDEVTRYINYSTLETAGDGDKSLVLFNRPADIAGTALLTHSHKADADDQWLYLPALKRVKRISSANKSGSFVGSEFAYEDLSTQEVEKYQYKLLREESCGAKSCFVVDAYPVDAKSGYTRQERWIDKDDLLLRKVNYYDRKGDLLKTLEISQYQKYLGRYWRAEEYAMKNQQNNKTTRLLWKNYRFRSGITADQFHPNALEKAQ